MRRVYCGRRGGGDQLPVTRDDEKRVRTCGVFPSSGSSLGDPSATPCKYLFVAAPHTPPSLALPVWLAGMLGVFMSPVAALLPAAQWYSWRGVQVM
ncbi:hypothetical protein O3P69_003322 [Scylla paramamosain]|uniref:Uncharacterized protein n=1 Tax=Scylla paramamosain TaxID=85552 RepID=A0AAW0UPK6_SCYPA